MMARDPTHTSRLRQIFRGEAQRRVRTLLTATREMLVEQGAFQKVGVHHPMMAVQFFARQLPSAAGLQLDMFTHWFNNACYSYIVAEANWLKPHVDRAYQHGLNAGEKITKIKVLASPDHVYYATYKNELEGIVDATVQQATRSLTKGLLNQERPPTLYRRVVSVSMKTLEPRLRMLGHHIIVQQHNLGLLTQFKAVGVKQVSVIPETLPKKFARARRRHDHAVHDQDLVEVLTAGDDDVCEDCEDYADAGPYEIEEVEADLPLHPNCRCAYIPSEDLRFAINRIETEEELASERLEAE